MTSIIDGNYYIETTNGIVNINIKNGCCETIPEELRKLFKFDDVRVKNTPHGNFLMICIHDGYYGVPQFKLLKQLLAI